MPDDLTASLKTSAAPQPSMEDRDRPGPQPPHRDLSPLNLDQRLDQALRTAPQLAVLPDFAAQVIARLPSSSPLAPTSSVTGTSPMLYAQRAMMLCLLVLLLALVVTAPHLATGSPRALAIQWTISAEVALIAVYLGPWRAPGSYRVR